MFVFLQNGDSDGFSFRRGGRPPLSIDVQRNIIRDHLLKELAKNNRKKILEQYKKNREILDRIG